MRKILYFIPFVISSVTIFGQSKPGPVARGKKPKLVVGIVVDQMRWDYLYRYNDRYANDGFKRLLNQGFSCENTFINYLPSYTAVGHTCVYTGSVPSVSGITGNEWVDQFTGKESYCTDDSSVTTIGANNNSGKMSPRNLLVSTITDELRIASNYKSKVIGVSLKDRAAILPAGHAANAAFWLDDATGKFVSSSYYMQLLPDWANTFNDSDPISKLISNDWTTLYPISTYLNSDSDDQSYEGKFPGETSSVFPHRISQIYKEKRSSVRATPFGNTLTLDFAKQAVMGYGLGSGSATDFLTINCASTDYVGHMFGPNSIEVEDTYLRLDQDLAKFFQFLDSRLGKGNYLIFLTADHGAAHNIGYMQKNKIPANAWNGKKVHDDLNKLLAEKFGVEKLVVSIDNYQLNFNLTDIRARHLDFDAIKKMAIEYIEAQPGIAYVVDASKVGEAPVPEPIKTMIINGYNFRRSGVIQIIPQAGWFESYSKTGTTHGTWNPYDTHIPLLFYGWNIRAGKSNRNTHMTDIAATIAAILHIQMPNGCIGKVIEEVITR